MMARNNPDKEDRNVKGCLIAQTDHNEGSEKKEETHLFDEWDRAERFAPMDVGKLQTTGQCLSWLHRIGQRSLVVDVRYYSRYGRHGLLLVDSKGHEKSIAERLRYGVTREEGFYTRESFYCFEVEEPTICIVDEKLRDVEILDSLSELISVVRVPDSCGKAFEREGKRLYIDVPVFYHGRPVLKFSCGFAVNDVETLLEFISVEEIEAFCRFAQLVGHVLWGMRGEECRKRLREERLQIGGLKTLDAIDGYVRGYLPKVFKCETVDFLLLKDDENTLVSIAPHGKRAVGESSGIEVPALVDLGLDVAKQAESCLFQNLCNDAMREEEFAVFGLQSASSNDYWHDPLETKSAMLIPVSYLFGEGTLGVLMLRNKLSLESNRSDLACFSDPDRLLAELVAKECLGPRIELIQTSAKACMGE